MSFKMETLPGFALNLLKGDCQMSWDVKSSHFYLHPRMCDYFLFRYGGVSTDVLRCCRANGGVKHRQAIGHLTCIGASGTSGKSDQLMNT
jgi:hypothetical protein